MPVAAPQALGALLDDAQWTRDTNGESGGQVFRVDPRHGGALFLKYGTGEIMPAIVDEMTRLVWLAGRVAVPAVRQFVCHDDAAWLLTAAMTGRSGDALLADDPSTIGTLAAAAGRFLRTLHAVPVVDCPFDAGAPLRLAHARLRMEAGLVEEDDFGNDHDGLTAQEVWEEMTALLPLQFDRVLTHGDYSLGNIFFEDDKVCGVIDVGRAGIADRYQDIAIMHENLAEHGAEAQHLFLDAYGLTQPDTARLRFHYCLDEFF